VPCTVITIAAMRCVAPTVAVTTPAALCLGAALGGLWLQALTCSWVCALQ
jgi:hypothetical protein